MPRKSWWARLPFAVRMVAGTSAVLLAIGAGVAGVALLNRDDGPKPRIVTAVGDAAPGAAATGGEQPPANSVAVPARTSDGADPAPGRNQVGEPVLIGPGSPAKAAANAKAEPRPPVAGGTGAGAGAGAGTGTGTADASPSARSVITTRTDTETREIPFTSRTVRDPGLPAGTKEVQTPGVAGEETLRYLVTLTDGRQTGRRLLDSTVTRPPQQEVVAVGSRSDRCGSALDLCVPIGRDATCGHGWRDESGQAADGGQSGQINVSGNGLTVLGGGHGDGGGWGGRGHGC